MSKKSNISFAFSFMIFDCFTYKKFMSKKIWCYIFFLIYKIIEKTLVYKNVKANKIKIIQIFTVKLIAKLLLAKSLTIEL